MQNVQNASFLLNQPTCNIFLLPVTCYLYLYDITTLTQLNVFFTTHAEHCQEKFQDLLSKMLEPPFDARLQSTSHHQSSRARDGVDLAMRYRDVMTRAHKLGELEGLYVTGDSSS